MRSIVCALIFSIAIGLTPHAQRAPATTFDDDKPGAPPAGFTFAPWRQPQAGTWAIRRQATNGYLWHAADAAAHGYSIALAPQPPRRDLDISARLRLAGGSRAGGLVWRYQDERNYYGATLDLVHGQLHLFRVTSGNRVFLELEDDLQLDVDAWHTLRVVHDDHEVRVSLGGIRVFEESDRRGGRTAAAGRAGVLAHGDADVWFDDLRIDDERPPSRNALRREGAAGAKPPGWR
jgi:hypothetical protein